MEKEEKIAYEILSYLAAKPSAKDTIQGITEWWMLRARIEDAVDKVSRALELLVTEDLVRPVRYQAQKKKYYEVNMEKMEEIKKILRELERIKGEVDSSHRGSETKPR